MLRDINERYISPFLYVKDMVKSRRIVMLFFRDKVFSAHKGKLLGNLWYIFDPLFQLLVWVFIFQVIFQIKRENYPIFLFSAIICWSFITACWRQGCSAFGRMGNFIYEVSFPKMILVVTVVVTAFYYTIFQLLILAMMLLISGVSISVNLFYLPFILLIMIIMGYGGAALCTVIGLRLKDFPHLLNPLLRLWWFLSPGLYSIERIPEKYRGIFRLNPMCGLFQSFRNITLYGRPPEWGNLMITLSFAIALLLIGCVVFYKTEPELIKKI